MISPEKILKKFKEDGLYSLISSSYSHAINTILPTPTVRSGSTIAPLWYSKYIYNFLFNLRHGSGVNVMTEDWDTLILFDACRFDEFKKINTIPGELGYRISQSVDSSGFINKNFVDGQYQDTIYVTANPHVKILEDEFFEIITTPLSNWDPDLGCVRPEVVTDAAINAHDKYPNKRIIVHYMQPHDPPIGPTGKKIRKNLNVAGPVANNRTGGKRIMELLANDEIDKEQVKKAYRETLEIVVSDAKRLLENASGKIVISADHGEMFGESPYPLLGPLYEHYQNPKTIELCKVPWFVVDNSSERRNIVQGTNNSTYEYSEQNIDDQLKALGYK